MIRINQIKLITGEDDSLLKRKIIKKYQIDENDIVSFEISRKSIDARKKPDIYYVYSVDVELKDEKSFLTSNKNNDICKVEAFEYSFPYLNKSGMCNNRPIIIGAGPAGLFCGYMLAKAGFKPIILERGKEASEREKDIEAFWNGKSINPESNVLFGEGGAGTFSDGKLNTLVKDKTGKNKAVLKIFVENGAPLDILYDAKPHLGTDNLRMIIPNLRREIEKFGGEVRFESKVTGFDIVDGKIQRVTINDSTVIESNYVVLAIGHSARDTFEILYKLNVPMEAKSFAVGLRVIHPRNLIDFCQYGTVSDNLPSANYKLTSQTSNGRGVYTFCMCPGGYVVDSSSNEIGKSVNGMSFHSRKAPYSNSAVIVQVSNKDYPDDSPLAGVRFQENLEKKAYELGHGNIPIETFGAFKNKNSNFALNNCKFTVNPQDAIKGLFRYSELHSLFPDELYDSFVEGMNSFGKKIDGFDDFGTLLAGIESRTSSPVRIHRDNGESSIKGLFPCGEGAGYAGGIMSAAMDGIYIAECVAKSIQDE